MPPPQSNILSHAKACIVATDRTQSRWFLKGGAGGGTVCVCVSMRESGEVRPICMFSSMLNEVC